MKKDMAHLQDTVADVQRELGKIQADVAEAKFKKIAADRAAQKVANESAQEATKNADNLAEKGGGITALKEAISESKMKGNQLVTDLPDGGKVLFRKESHPLPDSDGQDVLHWNIEVMRPRNDGVGKPVPGRFKQLIDTHITLDSDGKPLDFFHSGPKAPKK